MLTILIISLVLNVLQAVALILLVRYTNRMLH